jgi:predicted ArsR family transcriptional regulator
MSPPRARRVHDPRVLRAIAHPLRSRILNELSAAGPMRAADVARELGVAPNLASFHLRQLAKYGLVEEDPEAARDRRDRVWRMVDEAGLAISLAELEEQPGGKAAATVFRRTFSDFAHTLVEQAYTMAKEEGIFRSLTQTSLRLTREEAETFAGELEDLVNSWNTRTRGLDPERRTYVYFHIVEPYPELTEPERPE